MTELARLPHADADLTAMLARCLSFDLRPGDCLRLQGDLGAGKSHFARALIRTRLGDPWAEVPSPTFTLVQTYDAPDGSEIWHADLYRLSDPAELAELGLEDAFSSAITLIEWPDRGEDLPKNALVIQITAADDPDLRNISLLGDLGHWGFVQRSAQKAVLLHRSGWAAADMTALAGDASSRRYFRLSRGDECAILMDAAPGSCGPYLAMTEWLRERGFAAPEIYAQDAEAGLLLMQDLGDDLVARVTNSDPALTTPVYDRITDFLVELHRHPAPDVLSLDGAELARQVSLFGQHYLPAVRLDPARSNAVAPAIQALWDQLCADATPVCALRDFHAENIIWRGDRPLGLLDFQDAVAAHPAYDLVSVLQDVRRDLPPALEARQMARYCTATGTDPDRFAAAYALLGVARNLRILGIFARLAQQDGKRRYLAFMPRTWALIMRDLAHPALAPLAAALDGIPAPDRSLL